MNIKEKIAICYTCAGESYRESAYEKIKNYYQDDDNLYYFILTDDKNYFKDLERKNLTINELEDFRDEFPKLKDKEFFIKANNKSEYAQKVVNQNYLFPFSTYRFNVLQAIKAGIKNVVLLCTDTKILFDPKFFNDDVFDKTEMFYNALSEWEENSCENHMSYPVKILKEKHNLSVDSKIKILDATARMYIPKDLDSLKKFFYIWNDVIETLYENDEIKHFNGSYVVSDEYILAPIYNALNLTKRKLNCLQIPLDDPGSSIFETKHNSTYERFWTQGVDASLKPHVDYQEYLKINNLKDIKDLHNYE